jgi:AcrR family transcriptional regulator
MSAERRTYTKKARAEAEEATRLRITEAAVTLHGRVGPARTSISAIAEQAGVRRTTVYRHFADEAAIFDACSAHWAAQNPPPDIAGPLGIRDPSKRMLALLDALYEYYGRTEAMLENLLRDEAVSALVRERFRAFHEFHASLHEPLLAGRGVRGRARRRADAVIGHALAFATWKSLVREQGLSNHEAAELMAGLADSAR